MKYDFDTVINRYNTKSYKFDFNKKWGVPEDVLPMWVADMDFKTAPEIIERLKRTAEFGVFGYVMSDDAYFNAVAKWYRKHFDYQTEREWLITTPGIVFALNQIVKATTLVGDAIIIQRPVYYPFSNAIINNGRKLINSPLKIEGGKYYMDLADFERKVIDNNVKLFILCSPHNPVSRVWSRDELKAVGDICLRHGVIVVSDEIHSDFVFEGKHTMFSKAGDDFGNNSIICTAPSKTFNLAGLQVSNIFVQNPLLRKKIVDEIQSSGYGEPNVFGVNATETAYNEGEEWVKQMLQYIKANFDYIDLYLKKHISDIKLIKPEGTYLGWLDCRGLGLSHEELVKKTLEEAKVWFDEGEIFGTEGRGFMRINAATPRTTVEECMRRMEKAFKKEM